jgi:hypothetical protein
LSALITLKIAEILTGLLVFLVAAIGTGSPAYGETSYDAHGVPAQGGASPVGQAAPRLASQILIPTLFKEDWRRSSFDQSLARMLVVDKTRSFFLDVESGSEILSVALQTGEYLLWARPTSEANLWIAYTSLGKLTAVDPFTATQRTIIDLTETFGKAGWGDTQGGDISFEFLDESSIVAVLSMPWEKQLEDSMYRGTNHYILIVDIRDGSLLSQHLVGGDEFFSNGNFNLSLNSQTNSVALFDPSNAFEISFFELTQLGENSGPTRLLCSIDRGDLVNVLPFENGFLLIRPNSVVEYLDFSPSEDNACGTNFAERKEPNVRCRWDLGPQLNTVASAQWSRSSPRYLLIGNDLNLLEIEPLELGCRLNTARLPSIAHLYFPWKLQRSLGAEASEVDQHAILAMSASSKADWIAVSGGTLTKIARDKAVGLVELVGAPTGIERIEQMQGVLVGDNPLLPLRIWDGSSLKTIDYDYGERFKQSFLYFMPHAFAAEMRALALIDLSGTLRWHSLDGESHTSHQRLNLTRTVGLCASASGDTVVITDEDGGIHAFRRAANATLLSLVDTLHVHGEVGYLYKVACDSQARLIVIGDSMTDRIFVLHLEGSKLELVQELTEVESSNAMTRPVISKDRDLISVGPSLFYRKTPGSKFELHARFEKVYRLIFDDTGNRMLATGVSSRLFNLFRSASGLELREEPIAFPGAQDGALLGSGVVVLVSSGGELSFYQAWSGHPTGQLQFGRRGGWMYSANDGRFDTGRFGETAAAVWLMPDDPLRPLPPEIFMRDYYEPNLLGRLLACHEAEAKGSNPTACTQAFKPVRSLTLLNRIQPDVQIVSVRKDPERHDTVLVEVEASGRKDPSQPNGKTSTGVYDVRLFRNGQLVGQWPEPPAEGLPVDDVAAWREVSQVATADSRATRVFPVQLAAGDAGTKVVFTTYGFNEDRVKSATVTDDSYTVPQDITVPAKPRAYVIAVGINEYENRALRLNFAVADAEAIQVGLEGIQGYEVVSVLLASDYARKEGVRQISAVDHATKENIRDVLGLLAGKGEEERAQLKKVLGPVVDKLAKATPDDIVVLAVSSHGHTEQGRFYILPSDSGSDLTKLEKLISSEELTAWLREVDAGEMTMIVDACHSAAGVPAGFKPGPMGDRGLGQLAYDKGMRILAATQADDVALESGSLGQGLLTYALVREGLALGENGKAKADTDGQDGVTMKEWLSYAEKRVPSLYQDVLAGKIQKTKDSSPDRRLLEDTTRHAQTPVLFDFARSGNRVVMLP